MRGGSPPSSARANLTFCTRSTSPATASWARSAATTRTCFRLGHRHPGSAAPDAASWLAHPLCPSHADEITATGQNLAAATPRTRRPAARCHSVPYGVDLERFRPRAATPIPRPSRCRHRRAPLAGKRHPTTCSRRSRCCGTASGAAWPAHCRRRTPEPGGPERRRSRHGTASPYRSVPVRRLDRARRICPRFCRILDIFALPSLLRASASRRSKPPQCDLPVVASRIDGIPDVVSTAIPACSCRRATLPLLAAAIAGLVDDPGRAGNGRGRTRFRAAHYDWRRTPRGWSASTPRSTGAPARGTAVTADPAAPESPQATRNNCPSCP